MRGRGPACRVEGRRAAHLLVLLLACYLTLDFADPSMPGALNFNVDLNHDIVLTTAPAKPADTKQALPALPPLATAVARQTSAALRPRPLALSRAVPEWAVWRHRRWYRGK